MTEIAQPCLFCEIARGTVKANIVYRDDDMTAFVDINPVAPVHVLLIPNCHIPSLNEANEEHQAILGRLLLKAPQVAAQMGIDQSGYRVIINTGAHSGQTIFHLHVHILGGRLLQFRTQ